MPRRHRSKKTDARLGDICRIIDANLNRTKEGLRVCEDICRLHLRDACLTKKFGTMRHALSRLILASRIKGLILFQNRDTESDAGKTFCLGPKRKTFSSVFMANSQRVKEGLRVLEEIFKMCDEKTSRGLQKLRFSFYALEKTSVERFPSLLDS